MEPGTQAVGLKAGRGAWAGVGAGGAADAGAPPWLGVSAGLVVPGPGGAGDGDGDATSTSLPATSTTSVPGGVGAWPMMTEPERLAASRCALARRPGA